MMYSSPHCRNNSVNFCSNSYYNGYNTTSHVPCGNTSHPYPVVPSTPKSCMRHVPVAVQQPCDHLQSRQCNKTPSQVRAPTGNGRCPNRSKSASSRRTSGRDEWRFGRPLSAPPISRTPTSSVRDGRRTASAGRSRPVTSGISPPRTPGTAVGGRKKSAIGKTPDGSRASRKRSQAGRRIRDSSVAATQGFREGKKSRYSRSSIKGSATKIRNSKSPSRGRSPSISTSKTLKSNNRKRDRGPPTTNTRPLTATQTQRVDRQLSSRGGDRIKGSNLTGLGFSAVKSDSKFQTNEMQWGRKTSGRGKPEVGGSRKPPDSGRPGKGRKKKHPISGDTASSEIPVKKTKVKNGDGVPVSKRIRFDAKSHNERRYGRSISSSSNITGDRWSFHPTFLDIYEGDKKIPYVLQVTPIKVKTSGKSRKHTDMKRHIMDNSNRKEKIYYDGQRGCEPLDKNISPTINPQQKWSFFPNTIEARKGNKKSPIVLKFGSMIPSVLGTDTHPSKEIVDGTRTRSSSNIPKSKRKLSSVEQRKFKQASNRTSDIPDLSFSPSAVDVKTGKTKAPFVLQVGPSYIRTPSSALSVTDVSQIPLSHEGQDKSKLKKGKGRRTRKSLNENRSVRQTVTENDDWKFSPKSVNVFRGNRQLPFVLEIVPSTSNDGAESLPRSRSAGGTSLGVGRSRSQSTTDTSKQKSPHPSSVTDIFPKSSREKTRYPHDTSNARSRPQTSSGYQRRSLHDVYESTGESSRGLSRTRPLSTSDISKRKSSSHSSYTSKGRSKSEKGRPRSRSASDIYKARGISSRNDEYDGRGERGHLSMNGRKRRSSRSLLDISTGDEKSREIELQRRFNRFTSIEDSSYPTSSQIKICATSKTCDSKKRKPSDEILRDDVGKCDKRVRFCNQLDYSNKDVRCSCGKTYIPELRTSDRRDIDTDLQRKFAELYGNIRPRTARERGTYGDMYGTNFVDRQAPIHRVPENSWGFSTPNYGGPPSQYRYPTIRNDSWRVTNSATTDRRVQETRPPLNVSGMVWYVVNTKSDVVS